MSALDIAKTGMTALTINLDLIAHNISNANTTAFKENMAAFRDLGYIIRTEKGAVITDSGEKLQSGIRYGMGVGLGSVYLNYKQGTMLPSDSEYSIAINGPGFMSVLMPDGEIGYTRDGHLGINANRELTDANGLVIQPTITVPNDAMSITITQNGQIQVQEPGKTDLTNVGTIELTRFNVEQLDPVGNNLYKAPASAGIVLQDAAGSNGLGTIMQYHLEGSNVNIIEQFASMMKAEKGYQACSKVMQTDDHMIKSVLDIRT